MSMTLQEAQNSDSGCVRLVVWLVMPVMSFAAAGVGLVSGSVLTLEAVRVESRQVEEAIETRGDITLPVERVVQEGRVDVTVTRKILGLVPIQRLELPDVVDVDASSGTRAVTNSSGRTTSRYRAGTIELTTRGGTMWRSWEISHAFGASAEEIEEHLEQFMASRSPQRIKARSVPWLSNIIGVPFTLVAGMFVWMWITRLAKRA